MVTVVLLVRSSIKNSFAKHKTNPLISKLNNVDLRCDGGEGGRLHIET